MQTKNMYLQIANKCCLSLKSICFVSLAELDRFKQTESDKTNTLGIFASFILSVKGKSTKLGILQAFLQTLAVFILDKLYVQSNYANSTFACI